MGDDFSYNNFKNNNRIDFVSREGDNLCDRDYRIAKMMSERGKAKGVRDINQADFIRQRLRGAYRVFIDDISKEWHIHNDDYLHYRVWDA